MAYAQDEDGEGGARTHMVESGEIVQEVDRSSVAGQKIDMPSHGEGEGEEAAASDSVTNIKIHADADLLAQMSVQSLTSPRVCLFPTREEIADIAAGLFDDMFSAAEQVCPLYISSITCVTFCIICVTFCINGH